MRGSADIFDGMTPKQKEDFLAFLHDPKTAASVEYQNAYRAIEAYWNVEGDKTEADLDELLSELACVDDALEVLRDDNGWKGYGETIKDISRLARTVGVYWPDWERHKRIEEWEIVGPDGIAVPPKKLNKRKETKMGKKKVVDRRNVWIYQPGVSLENTPLEIRVTEPGSEKKLLGRLYISKGGVTWCKRNQRFDKKVGYRWETIAELLGE